MMNNLQKSIAALTLVLWGALAQASAEIYYVHSDHLGTPRVMTDQTQQVVWERSQTPFGETVEQNGAVTQPFRFPGQYEDAETGFHYNYFRDYDPTVGRYIQSDPIGLAGGLNTYGYAYQNPIMNFDPDGRLVWFGIHAAYWLAGGTAVTAGGACIATNCGQAAVDGISAAMSGLQTTPNSIPHWREDEVLTGFPGGGCDGLEAAIRDLKRTIDWRKGDLNPAERGTRNYVGHVQRIKKLQKRLDQLKREARDMGCNPDCE